MSIRSIAFYLPQYHPIPENDQWWGKGFTEWANVTAATPRFRRHYQPHLPADLGFYDLRLHEVMEAQADMASSYGIQGFCFYHYWFQGKLLLEKPIENYLSSKRPDFPFCLCWANENWTRSWNGRDRDVLLAQTYSEEDDLAHIEYLCRFMRDPRYIRIDGRPALLVYRVSNLPNAKATAERWRHAAHQLGIGEVCLLSVESVLECQINPKEIGFDYAVEFQPDWSILPQPIRRTRAWRILSRLGLLSKAYQKNRIMPYASLVDSMTRKPIPDYPRFPCIVPAWDNSSRRADNATVFIDSTPELYERWFQEVVRELPNRNLPENIIFLNAWNEWAEGCHLEPDRRWGHAYLEATQRALQGPPTSVFPHER
jgi:lipopolysaccharide biosynthesis protein